MRTFFQEIFAEELERTGHAASSRLAVEVRSGADNSHGGEAAGRAAERLVVEDRKFVVDFEPDLGYGPEPCIRTIVARYYGEHGLQPDFVERYIDALLSAEPDRSRNSN